jgi:hypothetical protein
MNIPCALHDFIIEPSPGKVNRGVRERDSRIIGETPEILDIISPFF